MPHIQLEIIRGLPTAPSDTRSVEMQLDVINLLDVKGFSVKDKGWLTSFAQIKNGGLFIESPINDGRTLVAAANGNVTETMTLNLAGATATSRSYFQSRLLKFNRYAEEFHAGSQIEPVYLKWWAYGAPGPQYSLIFTIQMARSDDPLSADRVDELTITIERWPYWRPIAPGENPKKWTYEFRKQALGSLDLAQGSSNHLFSGSLINRIEWTSRYVPSSNVNYIDIPAADIPGDGPALLFVNASTATIIAAIAKSPTLTARSTGATLPRHNVLSASDSAVATASTLVADTGANPPIGGGTAQRIKANFGTATDAARCVWDGRSTQTSLDSLLWRGKYAVFCRCRQDGGALGNITMYLMYGAFADARLTTPVVNPPLGAGSGNTANWPLLYMGIIQLPVAMDVPVNMAGNGLQSDISDLIFMISAARPVAAGELYINDLIFIPYDDMPYMRVANSGLPLVVDNTGYFGHGKPDDVVFNPDAGSGYVADTQLAIELNGTIPKLVPGVNNRLYFLSTEISGNSDADQAMTVLGDIVPQWLGVRDV